MHLRLVLPLGKSRGQRVAEGRMRALRLSAFAETNKNGASLSVLRPEFRVMDRSGFFPGWKGAGPGANPV